MSEPLDDEFDELEELRAELEQARVLLAGALSFLKERDCPYREAWVVPQIRDFLDAMTSRVSFEAGEEVNEEQG